MDDSQLAIYCGIYVGFILLFSFLGESRFKGPLLKGVPLWNWSIVATSPAGAILAYAVFRYILEDYPPWDGIVATGIAVLSVPGMYMMSVVDTRKQLRNGHMRFSIKGADPVRIEQVGEVMPEGIASLIIENCEKLDINPLASCADSKPLSQSIKRMYGDATGTELCIRTACAYQSTDFLQGILGIDEFERVAGNQETLENFVNGVYEEFIQPVADSFAEFFTEYDVSENEFMIYASEHIVLTNRNLVYPIGNGTQSEIRTIPVTRIESYECAEY